MAEPAAASARAAVLASVRSALAGAATAAPGVPGPAAAATPPALEQRVERFVERLTQVGGRVHRARDEQAAARVLAALVAELGARELALSDDALVRRLTARLPAPVRCFDGWSDRERLFACDLGLSAAQAGVAETGTLVLESSVERHRLVSLVPPVHVAVLHANAILSDLDQALAVLERAQVLARAVTLITGPSRTADIELELVVGVHGPRELHVVILEETVP